MSTPDILNGIDRVIQEPGLLNQRMRYSLLTNEASIDKNGITVKQGLIDAGFQITRLYSPEHGLDAKGEDGHFQPDQIDPQLSIPVISLYGNQLSPDEEAIIDYEALLIDLPNVGVRFYTYLWTMANMLEWCAQKHLPVIILDRPNPLGGELDQCEGPTLQNEYLSFIGKWNIPIRFGLTLGELASLLKDEKQLHSLDLKIVSVKGWTRNESNLNYTYPFKQPSPAILKPETIWTYPALCFLESTNISEGRGGPHSFEVAYAPWIKNRIWKNKLEAFNLPGVRFIEYETIPSNGLYQGISCQGLQLSIADHSIYRPVYTGLILVATAHFLFPEDFKWKTYPTLANPTGKRHFELLIGNRKIINWMINDPLGQMEDLNKALLVESWTQRTSPFLLYP